MAKISQIGIIAGQLVVGGAERQLFLWLSNLDRDRFSPVVLTLHPGHGDYWEQKVEELNIPLYRVPASPNPLVRLQKVIHLLKPHQPVLVHGWHYFASAYAGLVSKFLGVPCVGGIRSGFNPGQRSLNTLLVHRFCDAVVANSTAAAQAYISSLGGRSQAVFSVPNAIVESFKSRVSVREELSQRFGIPSGAKWIFSLGRMDPLKRFELLLDLAARLSGSESDFHFIIVGDGPEKSRLEALSYELGLAKQVSFLGEIPEAASWMKGMDVFCFPSMSEGLPNAVMEAAAAALPVVAWKLPFCEELFPGELLALLSEPGNLDAMFSDLSLLLRSDSLRARMGEAAQKHILENFGLDRFVQNMTSVYDAVLKRG